MSDDNMSKEEFAAELAHSVEDLIYETAKQVANAAKLTTQLAVGMMTILPPVGSDTHPLDLKPLTWEQWEQMASTAFHSLSDSAAMQLSSHPVIKEMLQQALMRQEGTFMATARYYWVEQKGMYGKADDDD